mgnify:CR=1 FL=1
MTRRTGDSVPIIEEMHQSLSIIGRGKLGRALAEAWNGQVQLYSREGRPSGWVLLAVPDDQIESIAQHFQGRCVHLSGSRHFPHIPCAHPLTSFNGGVSDWSDTPLAITGQVPDFITDAFRDLGFAPFSLPAEKKALYHAAAVFTSGHAATLWLLVDKLLRDNDVHLPGRGIWPLAEKTLLNLQERGEAGRTGPFVRNDTETIKRDTDALPESLQSLFALIGEFYEGGS